MNKKEIIKYCSTLANVWEDYPFPEDAVTVAMKHKENKNGLP